MEQKPIYELDNLTIGPSEPGCFRIREAIELRIKLGRPLSSEEMEQFRIADPSRMAM